MRMFKHCAMAAALAMAALAPLPAVAQPSALKNIAIDNSKVTTVAYRGNRHGFRGYRGGGNHRYGYHRNRGIGAGAIIGGIVASALVASAIRESRASDNDIERCEETYRSFDARTGTYTGYDGNTYVCPYLN